MHRVEMIFRQLRKAAGMTQGMTQAEMAELLRVPLSTLTRWEAEALDQEAKNLPCSGQEVGAVAHALGFG
jgi:transcriptional regulator with XRE-family HTH domain